MGVRGWVLGEIDAVDQITSRSEGLDGRDGPGAIHLRTRKVLPGKGGMSRHVTDDPGSSLDPGEHRRRAYAGDAEGLSAFHQHSARLNCGTGNPSSTCGAYALGPAVPIAAALSKSEEIGRMLTRLHQRLLRPNP